MNQVATRPDGLTRNLLAASRIEVASLAFPTHRGFRDLTRARSGSLSVLRYACAKQAPSGRRHYWVCACDCGGWAIVEGTALTCGKTTSCGCNQSSTTVRRNKAMTTHGEARKSVEYATWERIKSRCNNPNAPKFHLYGGRGIRVCDRWMNSFEAFLADMGRRPTDKTSIDRKNTNGNYDPGNCRWADYYEQNANRRAWK